MHLKKLLCLALSLFAVESVVASPCKPKTTSAASSIASTSLSESTTTILSVPSTTDTTLATIETSTATETSEAETETATTLLTTTTAASSVDTTTTEDKTTTGDETTTTIGEKTTTEVETTTAEAETTTTEAATTTTAEPVCAQTLVLANPTPIFISEATDSYDDSYRAVTVPFQVGIYDDDTSNTVYVSTNGYLSLFTGSSSFVNQPLRSSSIPSVSIVPYWDDLYILAGSVCQVGIYYDVYETARGQTFTVEWYVGGVGGGGTSSQHFSVSLYEDYPGLVRFEYYKTSMRGSSATVGLQNGQPFSQYSYNQPDSIPDQSFVEIDTSSGVALTLNGPL
ncbi:uncharacterized protein BKA55DRAFT_628329 [Fusarium redolens]|uniref:PA14 domain-containing protein n=1 Tax=Fusarium redolens TaxID=48865 RepID=A0A9P9FZ74_FUSRE|nr:uncharacterized protein BKA55DRAFT_628329 [Fusarium redolens]KAH7210740.1 hypothetical protein BKA55DRAFT_628329 [Fusarium redolens]